MADLSKDTVTVAGELSKQEYDFLLEEVIAEYIEDLSPGDRERSLMIQSIATKMENWKIIRREPAADAKE